MLFLFSLLLLTLALSRPDYRKFPIKRHFKSPIIPRIIKESTKINISLDTPLNTTINNQDTYGENLGICAGSGVSWSNYPYLVGIYYQSGNSLYFMCTGSIISSTKVLTAAHCRPPSTAVVGIGCTGAVQCGNAVFIDGSFNGHPSYNSQTYSNDYAVIKGSGFLTNGARSVSYGVVGKNTLAGSSITLIGYGQDSSGGLPNSLQYGTSTGLSDTNCRSGLGQFSSTYDANSMFCVQNIPWNSGSNTCSGDSGGPWLRGNTQIGVTSWGISGGSCQGTYECNCCPNYPSVAAYINSAVSSWISSV